MIKSEWFQSLLIVAGIFTGLIVLIFVICWISDAIALTNTNEYEVIITDKGMKGQSGIYMIFTEDDNKEIKVFVLTDSIGILRFDSSDIYASIQVGKKYRIETFGFRIPLLSIYENIKTIELIE